MTYCGKTLSQRDGNNRNKNIMYNPNTSIGDPPEGRRVIDVNILIDIADVYIFLCGAHDKIATLWGFCALADVIPQEVDRLKDVAGERGQNLRNVLSLASETTASDKLTGGKAYFMSVLPYLNHYHGWSDKGDILQAEETRQGIQEIPRYNLEDKKVDFN